MNVQASRYGIDPYNDGKPNECPENMYPWDVDYPEEDAYETFEGFKANVRYDSLNLPVSWWFDSDTGVFTLVWVMPRKGGRTWSVSLAPGYDRNEVEQWLEDWTKSFAAYHYRWTTA